MEVLNIQEQVTHAVIGGKEAVGFGIAATPEFVQMLSSSLYTNQKKAVVRETLCNAWDAHRASNRTDKPIRITLNDEWFTIQDFGLGIPHEKMEEIYCVYGASTKQADPNQTGGFGLGCKSPFAYSDNFNVENNHGGKKTKNLMTRSAGEVNGMPGMTEVFSVETQDTGLKVSIPMEEGDVDQFRSLIHEIVFYGGILAEFNGELLERIEYEKAENNFVIAPTPESTSEKIFVKYGDVIYPIPDHPDLNDYKNKITNYIRDISNKTNKVFCFIFMAEPNSINIAPSREQLTIQGRTLSTLKHILESINLFTNESSSKVENIKNDALFKLTKEQFGKIDSYSTIGKCISFTIKNKVIYKSGDLPWIIASSDDIKIFNDAKYIRLYFRAYKKFFGKSYYLKMFDNLKDKYKQNSIGNFIYNEFIHSFNKIFLKENIRKPDIYFYGGGFGESYYSSFNKKTISLQDIIKESKKHKHNYYANMGNFEWLSRPNLVISHAKTSIIDRVKSITTDDWDKKNNLAFWIVPKQKGNQEVYNKILKKLQTKGWSILDLRQKHADEPVTEKKVVKAKPVLDDKGLFKLQDIYNKPVSELIIDKDIDTYKSNKAKFVVMGTNKDGMYRPSIFNTNKLILAFGDDLVIATTKREANMYIKTNGGEILDKYLLENAYDFINDPNSNVHLLISMSTNNYDLVNRESINNLLKIPEIWKFLGLTKPTNQEVLWCGLFTSYNEYVDYEDRGLYDLMIRNVPINPKLQFLEDTLNSSILSKFINFYTVYFSAVHSSNEDEKNMAMDILTNIFGDIS